MTQRFDIVNSTTVATPGDWSNTNNKIEIIGAGAAGVGRPANGQGGHGGGAGAYTRQTAVVLTGGNATVTVQPANAGGTCSYVKATDSVNIAANSAAVNSATGGAAGTGNTANFRGGNGFAPAAGNATGGHGGGAAGPNGAGGDATISAAGSADGGTVAAPTSPAAGNNGTEFDSIHGCGTGAFGQNGGGFAGGQYGGGGSGHGGGTSGTTGVAGAGGLVVRTYFADQALTQPATYSDVGEAFFSPTLAQAVPIVSRSAQFSPVRPRRIAPDPGPLLGTPATLLPIGIRNLTQSTTYTDTGEAFFAHTLAGANALSQTALYVDPAEALFAPTIAGGNSLLAALYPDVGEAFFAATLAGGANIVPRAALYSPVRPRRMGPDPTPLGIPATAALAGGRSLAPPLYADTAEAIYSPALLGGVTPVARAPYFTPRPPRRIAPDPGPLGASTAVVTPATQVFASPLTADDGFTVLTADDGVTVLTVPWVPWFNDQPGLAFIDADAFLPANLTVVTALTQTAVFVDPAEAFFSHTLTPGVRALTQPAVFVDPGEAFFAHTLTPGVVGLTQPATYVDTGQAFFAHTLITAQFLTQSAVYNDTGEAFFAHVLTTPTNLIQSATYGDAGEAFFAHTLIQAQFLTQSVLYADVGEAFFAHTLAPGLLPLSQTTPYTDVGEAFFTAALAAFSALTAALFVDSAEAFFAATLTPQNALSQAVVYVDIGEVLFAPGMTSGVFSSIAGLVEFLATDSIIFPAFLEGGARQILTVPAWDEFGNVVPAIVSGPLEAQAIQGYIAPDPTEFLGAFSTDRSAPAENQASQLSGAASWTEFLATQPVAIFALSEFQASQGQVSPAPSEFLNSVITARSAPLENQAAQILNGSAWTEFQTVLPIVAVSVPAEFQTTQSIASASLLEFSAIQQANPFAPVEWLTVSVASSGVAQLETTALQAFAIPALLEFLNTPVTPGQYSDFAAQLEFQGQLAATMPAAAEWLANWRVDATASLEALPIAQRFISLPTEFVASLVLPNAPAALEFGAQIQVIGSPLIEASALLSLDQRAVAEWLAAVLRSADPLPVEFSSPMLFTDASVPLEFGGQLFVVMEPTPLEWVRTLAVMERPVTLEWAANILSGDAPTTLEWLVSAALIQPNIPLEALVRALNLSPAVFEWLGTQAYLGGGIAPVPIEFGTVMSAAVGLLNYERLAGVASDPDLALPIEWLALRPAPLANLRPGRLRTGGTFNRPAPFAAIDIGETDNFGFDFSNEVGGATIVSTSWTCRVAPFQVIGDLVPQAHVLSAGAYRMIVARSILDGGLTVKTGAFSVASIGNFSPSSVGGTYVLEATINLSNGRSLQLATTVTCKGSR